MSKDTIKKFIENGIDMNITHTDADGVGCRVIINEHLNEVKFLHVDYGKDVAVIKELITEGKECIGGLIRGNKVLITDFGPPQELVNVLDEAGIEWCVVDHHDSTKHLASKYPDKVWLEEGICSTKQLGETFDVTDDYLCELIRLIDIGDLFKDECEITFWKARELTNLLKNISGLLGSVLTKEEVYDNIANIFTNLRLENSLVIQSSGIHHSREYLLKYLFSTDKFKDIVRISTRGFPAELQVGGKWCSINELSTDLIIVIIEATIAVNNGVRIEDTLFLTDSHAKNFSSLTKLLFDKDLTLKHIVKLGVKGSIAARGSKHFEGVDVRSLGNKDIVLKGHRPAAGGFNSLVSVEKGNKEMLELKAKLFTKK